MALDDNTWLIEEGAPIDRRAEAEIARNLPRPGGLGVHRGGAAAEAPWLAIRLNDIVIHDNKKWFGEAEIRIDALVVHGHGGSGGDPAGFYQPHTFRFGRVRDGDRLPIDGGLLLFYGRPLHFLDVAITVSRDRRDSDTLAELLAKRAASQPVQASMTTLMGLAVAVPTAMAVTAAVGAAAVLVDASYALLRAATGTTIGLYRAAWLQHRDGFGIGRHPDAPGGAFRVKDLSFWYEIVLDDRPAESRP